MTRRIARQALLLALAVFAFGVAASAQDVQPSQAVHAPAESAAPRTDQDASDPPMAMPSSLADRSAWPSPVTDHAVFGFLLIDNAEYQRADGPNALRWDMLGWRGGDIHRFWFKTEGRRTGASSQGSEFEVQALYGKLVAPFFDLQAGVRVDERLRRRSTLGRVYAVLGVQGLAPYRFDIEPTLFLSQKGQMSGRLTATYDLLLSQRLILQPRLETNVAVQRDEAIGIGAGLNDAEVGVRLRYETRRELAPYLGLTWKESFGATHRLTAGEGGDPAHFVVMVGARMWF